ncbi:MAG: gamma-glutamyltransferase, partial [Pseudoclavibacter sp.]
MTEDRTAIAVATPHRAATAAAIEMAEAGGNAVDAAIAAATTLAVVYPHMCSLGGDMIALVRDAEGTTTCINASGPYGSGLSDERQREAQQHGLPITGPLTVSVPGVVRGWRELSERYGSRPVSELLARATSYAAEG